jgi:adenine-specific DNA methylase
MHGEWIGEVNPEHPDAHARTVDIRCGSAAEMPLGHESLDAVFTDPPYYGMVQYGELMHFLYIWLRKLMGSDFIGLEATSTKHGDELTGNNTEGRGIAEFAEGLAKVYIRMAAALKPNAPLAFTYHHNKQEAYVAAAMAILDAGLICTASLPCPAEMGGSIHISGTGSSIVDTVFVCRKAHLTPSRWLFKDASELALLMDGELDQLRSAGMKPTQGDIRCIAYGHITRMAVSKLHGSWSKLAATSEKLAAIRAAMDSLVLLEDLQAALASLPPVKVHSMQPRQEQQLLEI